MNNKLKGLLFLILVLLNTSVADAVRLKTTINKASLYQSIEYTLICDKETNNPFVDRAVRGVFKHENGKTLVVNGFCDSNDGLEYKLRFLPGEVGEYTYQITMDQDDKKKTFSGKLQVAPSTLKGLVRVDADYPSHFIWDGTGEHYFWNGTTAYWLMGWKDESVIYASIDRLACLGINRIRVAISGRQDDGSRWYEPMVKESAGFTFKLNPWVAKNPDSLDDPGFDVSRFNVPYWQKLDRLVAYAREKGVVVSLVFYVDGLEHGCDPFKKERMGSTDEKRYYEYAVARYASYNNIMWDVANEYHLFRTESWVKEMGEYLYSVDPYKHLISVHGHAAFPFRMEPWVNMVLYQAWDECGGFEFMMQCGKSQKQTGRILPQINEEYGYEAHYPPWGCGPEATKDMGGRSADNRRQLAWEIYMAGGYQTTGERADEGTGSGNDSGGGWINGRGNDSMVMLNGYAIIRNTFEQLEYWKLQPMPELVNYGNLCLAEPGEQYLVYSRIQHCRLRLPTDQRYTVRMINTQTGQQQDLGQIDSNKANSAWQYPKELSGDWAFILKRIK